MLRAVAAIPTRSIRTGSVHNRSSLGTRVEGWNGPIAAELGRARYAARRHPRLSVCLSEGDCLQQPGHQDRPNCAQRDKPRDQRLILDDKHARRLACVRTRNRPEPCRLSSGRDPPITSILWLPARGGYTGYCAYFYLLMKVLLKAAIRLPPCRGSLCSRAFFAFSGDLSGR